MATKNIKLILLVIKTFCHYYNVENPTYNNCKHHIYANMNLWIYPFMKKVNKDENNK